MTRGRRPDWADEPLAQWLRQQLAANGNDKSWLIAQIAARNGGKEVAAAAQVNRWTFRGEPRHAGQLRQASIGHLTGIFGLSPLDGEGSGAEELAERLAALIERGEAVENRLVRLLDEEAKRQGAR